MVLPIILAVLHFINTELFIAVYIASCFHFDFNYFILLHADTICTVYRLLISTKVTGALLQTELPSG